MLCAVELPSSRADTSRSKFSPPLGCLDDDTKLGVIPFRRSFRPGRRAFFESISEVSISEVSISEVRTP